MNFTTNKYNFLIEQYKNKIYSYSLYMLKNQMDADDVTQEVFIRIWQNEGKFNLLSAKTWIMKTTHNLCLDFLRKRTAMIKTGIEITEDIEESVSDTSYTGNPSRHAESVMLNDRIKEAISSLPENLKSVFVLYEMQGLKYNEISESLDMPVNSVKVYLMRARIKLQDELKSYAS